MDRRKIPVLIVGGGPIGLALAAELGWHGIHCELIEQGDGVVKTPKMNEVNTRSMEFCRRWGVADQVLDTPFPLDWPKDVVFVTSLSGYELGRIVRPPRRIRTSEHSPEYTQTCSQHWFDPILKRFASSFPTVSLRYLCRLDLFEQTPNGVKATVVDAATGAREEIEVEYLIGCDGAGSTVRRALGIELEGAGLLGHAVNMFFRAPNLLETCGKQPGTFFIPVDHSGVWGNLRIIDPRHALWRLMVNETDPNTRLETIDKEAHLRRGIGCDIKVEWIDLNIWRRQSVVAARYGIGRVFLAGDSVHQVSPTGALGMNTGMGDAIDLGWKLAAVLQGWGGAQLLASYDAERSPIGQRNVRMATSFHAMQSGYSDGFDGINESGDKGETLRRSIGQVLTSQLGAEFRTMGLQIGYRYDASPICIEDGTVGPSDDPETYRPSARPGMRAPHAWLKHGQSVLDLFGPGFTLSRLGRDAPEMHSLIEASAVRNMPLKSIDIENDEIAKLYERKLVLVRPDGHVAWRADAVPTDALGIIDCVRGAG